MRTARAELPVQRLFLVVIPVFDSGGEAFWVDDCPVTCCRSRAEVHESGFDWSQSKWRVPKPRAPRCRSRTLVELIVMTPDFVFSARDMSGPGAVAASRTIDVATALRMMTIDSAYLLRREDEVGSLQVGKFADVIRISADPTMVPADANRDIEVLMTMVCGLWSTAPTTRSAPACPDAPAVGSISLCARNP